MIWLVYTQVFESKSLTYSLEQSFANAIPRRQIKTTVKIESAGHVSVPSTLHNVLYRQTLKQYLSVASIPKTVSG